MRSQGGYGNECQIITFPLNYEASVSFGLLLIKLFEMYEPQWQSKDVIVLFYDDSQTFVEGDEETVVIGQNYGRNIKQFLDNYYVGHDSFRKKDMRRILDDNKKVNGRCGYIRNGFPFVFRDYKFNKFSFHVDGVNGKLSDIDSFSGVKEVFNKEGLQVEVGSPPYFKHNPFLSWASNAIVPTKTAGFRARYLDFLNAVMTAVGLPAVYRESTFLQMAESLKNQLIGKIHMPHSHMIDFGIQATTMEAYFKPVKGEKFTPIE